jgi:hypothetical protein
MRSQGTSSVRLTIVLDGLQIWNVNTMKGFERLRKDFEKRSLKKLKNTNQLWGYYGPTMANYGSTMAELCGNLTQVGLPIHPSLQLSTHKKGHSNLEWPLQ